MKIESRANLDKALNFLYDRIKKYYNHDKLKLECFNNSEEIDVEAIINKLKNDGCLHYGLSETNKNDFKISIDGCILKERGGYKWKFVREWFQRNQFLEKVVLIFIAAFISQLLTIKSCKIQSKEKSLIQGQQNPVKEDSTYLSNPKKTIKDSARHIK